MADMIYPTSQELREIAQDKLPRLQRDRPVFNIFPTRDSDNYLVAWEQMDNYLGLAQVRGLNGMPAKVQRTGGKRYQMQPGVYGEFKPIDELEMTTRRQWGQYNAPIDLSDLVMSAQDHLLQRLLDRMESIIWTLLSTGTFAVPGPLGEILHTDSYSMQTFTAPVAWATSATATPLMDFRNVKLLARGHSVTFDRNSVAYMNSTTANRLYSNTNPADLYGRRTMGLGTYNSPEQINQLLLGDNLPQIVEYDQGYLDDSNTFQLYIPTGTVIIVGQRPAGQSLGEFLMVRNANNENMGPGFYQKIIDHAGDQVPRLVEVHAGLNGGPALYYPSAIVRMSV